MSTLLPLAALLVVLITDAWVYIDAVAQTQRGTPVILQIGPLVLQTPVAWFVACLILWIIFFPLYVMGRERWWRG